MCGFSDARESLAMAVALMRCQSFLPLYGAEAPRTERAEAADAQANAALAAYCQATGIRRADLWRESVDAITATAFGSCDQHVTEAHIAAGQTALRLSVHHTTGPA